MFGYKSCRTSRLSFITDVERTRSSDMSLVDYPSIVNDHDRFQMNIKRFSIFRRVVFFETIKSV